MKLTKAEIIEMDDLPYLRLIIDGREAVINDEAKRLLLERGYMFLGNDWEDKKVTVDMGDGSPPRESSCIIFSPKLARLIKERYIDMEPDVKTGPVEFEDMIPGGEL